MPPNKVDALDAECANRTVNHEWPDRNIIEGIEKAQEFATEWPCTHYDEHLNMGIGGITLTQKQKWLYEFY